MKLTCCFDLGDKAFDPTRLFSDATDGILTDEHAASSYGLPVLANAATGTVYGPAELPRGTCLALGELAGAEEIAFARRAAEAGYHVGYDLPGDPIGGSSRDPMTGERR